MKRPKPPQDKIEKCPECKQPIYVKKKKDFVEDFNRIVGLVSKHVGVPVMVITGKSRHMSIVPHRWLAIQIAHDYRGIPPMRIAEALHTDHSMVRAALKRAHDLQATDKVYKSHLYAITENMK